VIVGGEGEIALRTIGHVLRPQPARVVLRPFVPADNDGFPASAGKSRVARLADRVLSLDSGEVAAELGRVLATLAGRHRDPARILQRRFVDLVEPLVRGRAVSADQALLAGAYLTEEYSFEAAALFNPSITPHPDQHGLGDGALRLILSLRAVGEGHVSSISFRTAIFDAAGELVIDDPKMPALSPTIERIPGGEPEDPGVRLHYGSYENLSQVVIFPVTYHQRHGLEDLRIVRFTDDDGHVTYLGTYTAFSGEAIRQELLRTTDFITFELNALRGRLSAAKGMAIFPRRIDGRFAMLGRHDHENIWLLRSNDLYSWDEGEIVISPRWPWEFIQLGNGGSPVEIDEGWLVMTHGVGAIRSYCLGACLLDKHDPRKLLARSVSPIVRPGPEARDGYVPNVAYSCGMMVVGRTLLLPYGVADSFTTFATISLDQLLASMR